MSSEPLVFIIIVNWNGKELTLECLESLTHLTYKNVKTVVVDNASTDGSIDAIRHQFPGVVVLPMNRNLRFAGGSNAGITYGVQNNADMVLLLNNDTIVEKNFLTTMVRRMQSSESVGMVAPKVLYYDDPRRIWYAGAVISMWTGTMRHIGIREIDNGQYDLPGETDYGTGCCLLVRREVVDRTGMLDETFSMYTEDADWCARARKAGFSILYEPEAKIWHKVSVSSGGHLSLFKARHKFRGNMRFFARHASWYHWLVFPWANLLVNALAAMRYIMSSPIHRSSSKTIGT